MAKTVKWGFVGSGRITYRFMAGLVQVEGAKVTAIYSRRKESGEAFAQKYGVEQVHDDFEAFLKSGIDVAYIAVPHEAHLEYAKRCLEAGIAVLCEKPITPNLQQTREMVDCAKKNKVFLMEAFWTRCFPVSRKVVEWVRSGKIGDLVGMQGMFAFSAAYDPADRTFNAETAGGALLDIGVYPINFANMVAGQKVVDMQAAGVLLENGVDQTVSFNLQYQNGAMASILCSFATDARDTMTILGTKGRIEVSEDFWRPNYAVLTIGEETVEERSVFDGEGYQFEVQHVHDCLAQGLTESPLMTLEQSLEGMEICDRIRKIIGVVYPFEK